MRALLLLLTAAVFALVGSLLAMALYGCTPVNVGPYLPDHPKSCRAEPDCPVSTACRFPATDTHATCMPIGRGVDDVMDNMPNEPAQ
jgi:hypothetical protein